MHDQGMTKYWIRICTAALLLSAGCGGSSSPGASDSNEPSGSSGGEAAVSSGAPVHKSGGDSVSATIGAAGGTLDIPSGARVVIPAGTFSEPTDVVLSKAPETTAFSNDEHQKPVGPVFQVSPGMDAPEGSSIDVSIPLAAYPQGWGEVSLGYEYPAGNMVGAEDSEHTRWQYEDGQLTNGRAVAHLPGLTGYRLQFVLTNLNAE